MEKPITRRKVLMYALFHNHQNGLCASIRKSLEHFNIPTISSARFLPYMIPLFTYECATKFGASENLRPLPWYSRFNQYWWVSGLWIFTGRLRFHLWLLKQYWNDETDLKQVCQEYFKANNKIL